MNQSLNWGLLSTAQINLALIRPIRDAGRSSLLGVASRDQQRADAYAATHDIPRAYGSYEAMLADPDIDVVYISLPNTLHAEWTIKAIDAGKHVLCEKPLVPTVEAFDRVAAAAEAQGVTVFEAFMYLHHPQTLKAEAMVRSSDLGHVQLIESHFSFYLPPEDSDNIRLNPELAGGALWDVGVYPTSMALTMAGGRPVEVWSQQRVGETGVDVTMIGQMRFSGGASAQISAGFRMPFREGTVIVGDGGTLTIPKPWKPGMEQDSELHFQPRDGKATSIVIPQTDPYLCEVEVMEACVLDGADPLLPLSKSRDILRTVLALYKSAQTNRPATP